MKRVDQRAWLFLIPALVVLSLNAFIPLMTVVNYSVQDILPGLGAVWVGFDNFENVLRDPSFRGALTRQLGFSALILLIQVPLGILVALGMPKKGWPATAALVTIGLPLLIPWNVVGIIWRVFTRSDIGIVPFLFDRFGYVYNIANSPADAYWTVVMMDVWHWTPLIALLAYSGLNAIPDAFYQAARIDGATRWRTFWVVTLPRLRNVLTIGILLRFMDSFRIYIEISLLTGGGPGRTTAFVSDLLVNRAVGGFEFGYAAALSLIYFFIIIVISYLFFLVLTNVGTSSQMQGGDA